MVYRVRSWPGTNALDLLVWIESGNFTMGSPGSEQGRSSDEGPQTQVTISEGFWMGRFEVTQREFLTVMGSNPSLFVDDLNRPVEQVSWSDATNFCGRLTTREEALGRLPGGYIYRLPTDAEWEYACRAGSTARFSYGDDPDYSQLPDYAWYHNNHDGIGKPNPSGGTEIAQPLGIA